MFLSKTKKFCSHVSRITALTRSAHRRWSPVAIKFTIMTIVEVIYHSERQILNEDIPAAGIIAMGAGHVNPERAINQD